MKPTDDEIIKTLQEGDYKRRKSCITQELRRIAQLPARDTYWNQLCAEIADEIEKLPAEAEVETNNKLGGERNEANR